MRSSREPLKPLMDDPEARKLAALTASDWGSPIHVHALVLMALTAVGVYF